MDTRAAKSELQKAREVLESKNAPLEGTAAGHLILALEELITNLDNSFGFARRGYVSSDQANTADMSRWQD